MIAILSVVALFGVGNLRAHVSIVTGVEEAAVYPNNQLKQKIEPQMPARQSPLGALVGGYKRDPIVDCHISSNIDIKRLRCSPYPPLEARRPESTVYNPSPADESQEHSKPKLKEIAKMRKATNISITAKGAILHKVLSVTDCNPAKNRVLINRVGSIAFIQASNNKKRLILISVHCNLSAIR